MIRDTFTITDRSVRTNEQAIERLFAHHPGAVIDDIAKNPIDGTWFINYHISAPVLYPDLRQRSVERWDKRFLQMAQLVASWSKDPSTKCGAVIVRPDKSVASLGFNGFPRGCDDSDELYQNRDEKLQRVLHAEVNAVLQARCDVTGFTLYTWPPGLAPTCDRCATVVIQAGIKRVVYVRQDNNFTRRWDPARSLQLYKEAGVEVVPYDLEENT